MKKILVINGKGGVGKTTASIELFAPYLYLNNNLQKTTVYSFDEENYLNNFYENSDVVNIKAKRVNNVDMEDTISSVVLKDKPLVVDVGANKTTTYTLAALENTGLIFAFDLIAIPITDGEQDTLNAKSIYNAIKRIDKSINVVFILSRYVEGRDITLQFESFFELLFPLLSEKDKVFIKLTDSDAIKYAKKASKTIYELSMDKTNYDSMIKESLKNKESKDEILKITKQKMALKIAQNYRVDVLNNAFEVLNTIKE